LLKDGEEKVFSLSHTHIQLDEGIEHAPCLETKGKSPVLLFPRGGPLG
jgi:hypothetical protein